jgi:hypothetical protein
MFKLCECRKWKYCSYIFIAVVLSFPILLLYFSHYLWCNNNAFIATWFIGYDMPYYMANAQQYLKGMNDLLLYSNPYDFSLNAPSIYFQPLVFAFALILHFTSVDPGLVFAICGFVFTCSAFFVLQLILDKYITLKKSFRFYLLIIVAWGGGCLTLFSVIVSFIQGNDISFYLFDPFAGWWFLNLGRNFVYPTEAFYHLIILSLFLSILLNRIKLAFSLVVLMLLSQPFTGLQYSLIFLFWLFFERFFLGFKIVKISTFILYCLMITFLLFYYLLFLPLFPSHYVLLEQWKLNWNIKGTSIIAAYCVVGLLVYIRCCTLNRFKKCFKSSFCRFLLISAIISFLLANHEFFIDPVQPLHFTRGHIWFPLCLLGLPVIVEIYEKMKSKKWHYLMIKIIAAVFLFLMLSDNFIFFYDNCKKSPGIYLTKQEKKLLNVFSENFDKSVVISEDTKLAYLLPVYTSGRPYFGHLYNTPMVNLRIKELKTFFESGEVPEKLYNKDFIVLATQTTEKLMSDKRFKHLTSVGGYSVFIYKTNKNK